MEAVDLIFLLTLTIGAFIQGHLRLEPGIAMGSVFIRTAIADNNTIIAALAIVASTILARQAFEGISCPTSIFSLKTNGAL